VHLLCCFLSQLYDVQVSIRTGMDALVASTAQLGSRLLTDSVVGPPRVKRQRRRQPALEEEGAGTWQPGWPSEGRPLAARIFAA
jgi:hypothetical protein